jgi:CheY-like chemotaxis protein
LAVEVFIERGYRVVEAEHAAAAVLFLDRGLRPRLLFTDVHMPGTMGGIAFAEHALSRHQQLRIIITSARPLMRPIGHLDAVFLPKPYELSQLHAAVDKAMAA